MTYVPCRSGAPEREETVVFPDWVVLDRKGRTNCHDNHAAASEAVSEDDTGVALHTASGHSCYLSFTLMAPPRVSYLNLHWPDRPAKSVSPNFVLAADKNIFLLRVDIPSQPRCNEISSDLFVYTVGPPPSVLPLPVRADGDVGGTSLYKLTLGILRLSGYPDSYIVCDLIASAKKKVSRRTDNNGNNPIVAKLCFYSSKRKNWKFIHKPIRQLHGQSNVQFPSLWSSDDVLPFDGRFLCWVDYFSGVLLADFSKIYPSALHFVPFPGKDYPDDVRVSRLCPGRFQRVSVSNGAMRFVYIDNDWHETLKFNYQWDHIDRPEQSKGPPHGSKITIWNLNMVDGGGFKFEWEVHRVINLDCLWAHCSYQDERMPQRLPEFPFVTVDDPDVLCCLVREEDGYYGKAWMIMVDMKGAYVRSCTPYINEQPCFAEGTGMEARRSMFADVPLLPTVFSTCLQMPQEPEENNNVLSSIEGARTGGESVQEQNTRVVEESSEVPQKRQRTSDVILNMMRQMITSFDNALKTTEPLPMPKVTPPTEILDALKTIKGLDDSDMLRAYGKLIINERLFEALMALPENLRKQWLLTLP